MISLNEKLFVRDTHGSFLFIFQEGHSVTHGSVFMLVFEYVQCVGQLWVIVSEHCKLVTYDIKDLYVNIPLQETLKITELMLNKENDEQITKQIITLLDAILKQNYFEFQNNLYQPEKGVAMGSPISGIMAEVFFATHRRQTHKTLTRH